MPVLAVSYSKYQQYGKINSMNAEEKYIIGTCREMCPPKEAKMREKQRLLHILEIMAGTEKLELPKRDQNRVVKSFSRSAAGKSFLHSENLRPPDVLMQTVHYLLYDVISDNNEVLWMVKYDFIMDRLRAVRQDMVIQNVSRPHQITILQPIIRFLAYSAYRCCEENLTAFDPHINNTHLQECLKRLLSIYDYFDNIEKYAPMEINITNEFLKRSRLYFETMYLIFNLGDTSAITRSLELPVQWRTGLVAIALEMSLNYINNKFVKVCRLLKELPITLQMIAILHMPELRRLSMKIMSVAYSSKHLCFPVNILTRLLLYNTDDELLDDCQHYGLKVIENGVCFSKTDFIDNKVKVKPKRSETIDTELEQLDVTTLLLHGE